jgi:DNA-directed RNA polymerase specialized sigma24 family protein
VEQAVALRLDRRLRARVGVSDVVQDTYLEAARRLAEYLRQPPLPLGLWLRWLARERVLMLHRQHLYADKRAVGREAPPLPADRQASPHFASRMIRPYTSRAASICSCACRRSFSVGERLRLRSRISN